MTEFFPAAVYILCFLTSGACGLLLGRSYRRSGSRLLLWSALCFLFLAANNLTLFFDLIVFPESDFRLIRHVFALSALGVLLFGFIWDLED